MKNKILVELYVAQLNETFNVMIPTNEYVEKIVQMIKESVFELTDINDKKNEYCLLDPETGNTYNNSDIIRETNIKNSKRIILF